jgi:hypothetical protein
MHWSLRKNVYKTLIFFFLPFHKKHFGCYLRHWTASEKTWSAEQGYGPCAEFSRRLGNFNLNCKCAHPSTQVLEVALMGRWTLTEKGALCGLGKEKRQSPAHCPALQRDFQVVATYFLCPLILQWGCLITWGLRTSQMRLLLPNNTMNADVSNHQCQYWKTALFSKCLYIYNKGSF